MKTFEKKYKNTKAVSIKNSRKARMARFFENYEIIEIERQNKKGFGAITVGNKKTGKVEMFFSELMSMIKQKKERKLSKMR